ncbi:hypothetical protein Q4029_16485 [Acinetobacter baumannii]|uniref:Uncharacterized protein n=1 Tax=Acinetobacter baumannii TaxID=470 RepID=A0A1S2G0J3_ACIBA|nr:hypothetical protein [Acinetobacter baumannii]AWO68470.1 hypothetical protein [Acinetobacter baumannii]MCE6437508.1 hypothetical protein [Acinetobacter baumannii]MCZ0626193.1 hypothetical protein [Acinetobacter baumannii]MCZ0648912.1 hypothetical protein [Acinetobacter baumannii]MDW2787616.1 hypothetical protein [Acinetobacter baumannii]
MKIYTKIALNYFRNLISACGKEHGIFFSESPQNPKHLVANDAIYFITQIDDSIVFIDCKYGPISTYWIDGILDFTSNSIEDAAQIATNNFRLICENHYTILNCE